MEKHFKFLEDMWVYYFGCFQLQPYEYDIYGQIIDKIRKNDFDFTEDDKNKILKLINIFKRTGDECEIKILEKIQLILQEQQQLEERMTELAKYITQEELMRDSHRVSSRQRSAEKEFHECVKRMKEINPTMDYSRTPFGFKVEKT